MATMDDVMSEHNVLYAVVTDPDGQDWKEYGNKHLVSYEGIVTQYFPGPQAMRRLNEFLEGQMLPKAIMQGEVMCVICKPFGDTIVGLFVRDEGDVVARIRRGRAINASVQSALSKPES